MDAPQEAAPEDKYPRLEPLHNNVLIAQRLRMKVREINLIADELEASAPARQQGSGVYWFGEVKWNKDFGTRKKTNRGGSEK